MRDTLLDSELGRFGIPQEQMRKAAQPRGGKPRLYVPGLLGTLESLSHQGQSGCQFPAGQQKMPLQRRGLTPYVGSCE